ncbi:HSP90 family protein [Streptomyces diastaticus]|uniref:HSP90 family protein n=1 Tax=Streptomyces diastaticus TaxID=1956 RepID=UPI0035D984F1
MLHSESAHSFQVDLRGLVDLLSHHLYSSPRVYLRELLQNAADAITARRAADPGAPATITVRTGESLTVTDTGAGLTEADVHRFLATIGRSSKRHAEGGLDGAGLESARGEFIGQFGIGLLACFVVADEITVISRPAADPGAPTVEWRGHADGRYTIRTLPADAMPEPGTTVRLTPRADNAEWTSPERVTGLARHFGGLLKPEVTVVDPRGTVTRINDTPPWERSHGSPLARREALTAYCRTTFGFTPLDTIELDLPAAGLRGVAYVLPTAVSPAQRAGHRVHLKGMLLTDKAPELLPDWAFFVRCVVDTTSLRPTASREALYEDGTLSAVRDALGRRVRDWLTGLAASDPALLHRFIDTHHLAVKALARHDDELQRVVLPWLPFETTDGDVTLEEFARNHPTVLVTRSVEEFRQVAPIASAAGLGVVNGGYTYDRDLVHRLPEIRPGSTVTDLDPATVTAHLDAVDPSAELRAAAFLALARETVGAPGRRRGSHRAGAGRPLGGGTRRLRPGVRRPCRGAGPADAAGDRLRVRASDDGRPRGRGHRGGAASPRGRRHAAHRRPRGRRGLRPLVRRGQRPLPAGPRPGRGRAFRRGTPRGRTGCRRLRLRRRGRRGTAGRGRPHRRPGGRPGPRPYAGGGDPADGGRRPLRARPAARGGGGPDRCPRRPRGGRHLTTARPTHQQRRTD